MRSHHDPTMRFLDRALPVLGLALWALGAGAAGFAGTPRGDSVWLFSASGTLDEAAPAGSETALQEAEH